jgi:hypothetical protein
MFAPAIEETRQQSRNLLVMSNQSVGRASELKIDEFDRWIIAAGSSRPGESFQIYSYCCTAPSPQGRPLVSGL